MIEIAPFHGTFLQLIILLSLKAESKSVLHSVNFQSYPLSIESSLYPLLRSPLPKSYHRENKRIVWKKKDSNIHKNHTVFADCLDHSIAIACRAIAIKTLRIYSVLLAVSYQLALPICTVQKTVRLKGKTHKQKYRKIFQYKAYYFTIARQLDSYT